MKRWWQTGILLLIAILVSLTACGGGGSEEDSFQLAQVVRDDFKITVAGNGNAEASQEAKLTFDSGGRVDKIYVKEGDSVNEGDVLAELDTTTLGLAKSQAQISFAQAQVAVTQAKLAQQTAELNLKKIQDTEDSLAFALFNVQISLRNAEHHVDETQDIYTWPDIETAQHDVDNAKAYLEYVLDDNLSTATIAYAKARVTAAEAILNAKINSYDTEEVAIAKMEMEADEKAVAQAEKNIEALADDIAIQELQIATAKEAVTQAQKSVELAELTFNETQRKLDEAIIIAPFNGVVANVYVEEQDYIPSPGLAPTTVIYLINASSMDLIVEMDEIDIPGIEIGQEAIVEIDALSDTLFQGTVAAIFPTPNTVGGVVLYDVKITLHVDESSGIKIGMSATADIVTSQRSNVLLVPTRAIAQDEQGKPIVKVRENEQMQERQVVTGISDSLQTEIISGLREGETVVITSRVKAEEETSSFFF